MAKFDDYKDIWVFVEQRNGKFMNVAMELLGEATKLNADLEDRITLSIIHPSERPSSPNAR